MAKTILVVDDDPHIRDVVVFAVEKAGMVAGEVSDGRQALQAAKGSHCLLYTSPSPRDRTRSRMPSST